MDDDLEMGSDHRPKQQIEWHKWGDNGGVWMGEHRHPTASVWVPEWQLMKMKYGIKRYPPHLEMSIPVVGSGYLGKTGQDPVTEAERKNNRANGQPSSFAFELRCVFYPIPAKSSR